MLWEALGTAWVLEYPVFGWGRIPNFPTTYKLDIACPEHRIGIEVHGKGHGKIDGLGNPKDRKKREFLQLRGWTILWVWNEPILSDLSGTLRLLRETTSLTGCSCTTAIE
jgi:hypothetical protein